MPEKRLDTRFNKSLNKYSGWFTLSTENIFLGHCAISPLFCGAASAIRDFTESMAVGGVQALPDYFEVMPRFHQGFAGLLKTGAQNISYVQNTAAAMSMIAHGYPFQPGDQIISYVHEYPSNHYPWVMQQQRGVELVLLSDTGSGQGGSGLRGWSMEELERRVTDRTRIVAVSHVQFASGFAADLEALGSFCRGRDIDLIVDCAQSLGSLPVYPEQYHIAALASSGWKWLMGPFGAGVMYTSEGFRQKLRPILAGPAMMQQGLDYLNHDWNPHADGRMFEFSTVPWDHAAALQAAVSELFLDNSMESIRDEIFRLQQVFIDHLDPDLATAVLLPEKHRSGIVTLEVAGNPRQIIAAMQQQGVLITGPTGVLRLAPHFYMEDAQLARAAEVLNTVLALRQ